MEIEDFIKHFAEQFDDTDVSEFKPETVFHELDEYSSLIALTIIGMIDENYGVAIGAEEMSAAATIEDLYNTVKSKL
jgi:acyl carrier protein